MRLLHRCSHLKACKSSLDTRNPSRRGLCSRFLQQVDETCGKDFFLYFRYFFLVCLTSILWEVCVASSPATRHRTHVSRKVVCKEKCCIKGGFVVQRELLQNRKVKSTTRTEQTAQVVYHEIRQSRPRIRKAPHSNPCRQYPEEGEPPTSNCFHLRGPNLSSLC
jgi:hypothetical protein